MYVYICIYIYIYITQWYWKMSVFIVKNGTDAKIFLWLQI